MNDMNEKEIIICVGLPGAGKTTFAKQWVAEDPKNRFRFNSDELLKMMTEGVYTKESYLTIRDMQSGFIKGITTNGKSCILDNTHMNPVVLNDLLMFLDIEIEDYTKDKYNIIIKDFTNISKEECIRRDSLRDKPIGESIISYMYDNMDKVKQIIEQFASFNIIKVEKI